MCAFKFRLESVVGLKKQREDERKIALACAKKDLKQKLEDLNSLQRERRNTVEAAGNTAGDSACAVERSREDVESKRDLLLRSSREKKALENLRDKMKARYLLEARKAEQASLDETASRFHTLKSQKGLHWKEDGKS